MYLLNENYIQKPLIIIVCIIFIWPRSKPASAVYSKSNKINKKEFAFIRCSLKTEVKQRPMQIPCVVYMLDSLCLRSLIKRKLLIFFTSFKLWPATLQYIVQSYNAILQNCSKNLNIKLHASGPSIANIRKINLHLTVKTSGTQHCELFLEMSDKYYNYFHLYTTSLFWLSRLCYFIANSLTLFLRNFSFILPSHAYQL